MNIFTTTHRFAKRAAAIVVVSATLLLLVSVAIATFSSIMKSKGSVQQGAVALKPWATVGGCGAGGGGGGGAASAKWIGEGVSGGIVEVESMYGFNYTQVGWSLTMNNRFSMNAPWSYSSKIGIAIPLTSKSGQVQFVTNQEPTYHTTGGLGDITVDYAKTFGVQGEYNLSFALTMPTGQYDIKRGSNANSYFLPSSLQKGGGIYNLSTTLSWSKDVENGIWLVDVGYSHGFNMKPFTGENAMIDTYGFTGYSKDNSRFYYRFKPYGENDFGDFTPPSANVGVYYGYRGAPNYVHSFGATFSAPFGVAWIRNEKVFSADNTTESTPYNPRPDPDHQAWSATLVYGLEFSRIKYPVFFSLSLPIHDKKVELTGNESGDFKFNPDNFDNWDGPDWSDFLNQATIFIGFKSTFL